MANNINLIVFPVTDLDKAKQFYKTFLGTDPYAESDFYVGYRIDGLEIGLDPHGKAVVSYIDVTDINESLKSLKEAGAEVVMDVKDVAKGLLVAQVKDSNGNVLGLRQQPR